MGQGVTRENGKAEQGALKGMYRLLFVDDEGEVRVVPALMVIKVSFTGFENLLMGSIRSLGSEQATPVDTRTRILDGIRDFGICDSEERRVED